MGKFYWASRLIPEPQSPEAYTLGPAQILSQVPTEVMEKFYGCGAPLPEGIEGLTVLDLGSGSGRDCYVAAALVGESGRVIGVDMTVEQIQVRPVPALFKP